MSIDITAGSPLANSYVTATEANMHFAVDYAFQEELAWSSLSTSLRESVLLTAARQVDLLRFRGTKLFAEKSKFEFHSNSLGNEQALAFPRSDHPYLSGHASGSSSASELHDSQLEKPTVYPDGFFVNGSLYIREGTNQFEIRRVSGFDAESGVVTVVSAFSAALEPTSEYRLLYPIPTSVKRAQLAQAKAILDQSVRMLRLQGHGMHEIQLGDVSVRFRGILKRIVRFP